MTRPAAPIPSDTDEQPAPELGPRPRRSPAMLATLVAVPVAVMVGLLVFWNIGGFSGDSGSGPAGDPPRLADTGPVDVSAEPITAEQTEPCRALLAILPQTGIRDAARRAVVTGEGHVAAFGDPPITLTCGGAGGLNQPGPSDQVWKLNDTCWLQVPRPDGTLWTTVDRKVPLAVHVPTGYAASAQWAMEFANPISATIPKLDKPPAGCLTAAVPS